MIVRPVYNLCFVRFTNLPQISLLVSPSLSSFLEAPPSLSSVCLENGRLLGQLISEWAVSTQVDIVPSHIAHLHRIVVRTSYLGPTN
jgi:hypothetical protein